MNLWGILEYELAIFEGRSLFIIETGTIRNDGEQYRVDDGWSTLFFAKHVSEHGGLVMSIDLNIEASLRVLTKSATDNEIRYDSFELVEGDSVETLIELIALPAASPLRRRWDVAYLDSDNRPELIMNEFLLVRGLMNPGGIIMIDDVDETLSPDAGAQKGHAVIRYLKSKEIPYRVIKREGHSYRTGVLVTKV